MTFRGHFDGKVVVLDEPADLRPNQSVTVSTSKEPAQVNPAFGTLAYAVARIGQPISDQDAAEMSQAIEEEFEQINPDPDVKF